VAVAVNEQLGTTSGISVRTLREDLKNMRIGGITGYDAPIEYDSTRGYYYSDPAYSILNSPLTIDDLVVLQQAIATLKQLQGLGLSDDLQAVVQRLELRFSYHEALNERVICQFEHPASYVGQRWLTPLYAAISSRQAQWLTYQSFQASEPQREVVHPYLLKQYNQRWFLVAQREGHPGSASVFALDRIQDLEIAPDSYQESQLAPDTFFAHLLGVSILPHTQLQKIRLCFADARLPYVLTKPLHSSQEVETSSKGPVVSLTLVPTRELITLLLSFGADVEIIEPPQLREQIRIELERALNSYAGKR
jgi:predicted DNA-binding transcriptional regulator YafY